MHNLFASPSGTAVSGILAYVRQDHAFDFRPLDADHLTKAVGTMGTASLLVGSLQVEVGVETGRFLYVWGYHPMQTWKDGVVNPPSYRPGLVSAATGSLKPGVSEAIAEVGHWHTLHDGSTGWVQLSSDPVVEADSAIEFAEDVVAGIAGGRLMGLWLRPIFE